MELTALRKCSISNSFNLFVVDTGAQQVKDVREPSNWIFIYDRSGSMYNLISDLCNDLANRISNVPAGDSISVGWFSSEGLFQWVFKNLLIDDNNREFVKGAILKTREVLNLTCFSEIIEDANRSVIPNMQVSGGNFNMMFFTDGYPVVSNYLKEVDSVKSSLVEMSSKVSNAILVGYGGYYNKQFMSQMSEWIGGALVHSERLNDFMNTMNKFMEANPVKKRNVKIPTSSPIVVCYFDGNSIVNAAIENQFALVPENVSEFFVLEHSQHMSDLVGFDTTYNSRFEPYYYKAALACAHSLISRTMTDLAVELIGATGDVHLVKSVVNAWTNAEYGSAQNLIVSAIVDPQSRYLNGIDFNYIPDPNAFCLIDALELLMNDDKAYFYPRHEWWNYNPIGIPSIPMEGYPKFIPFYNVKCEFNKLTWNKSRLNLSILAKIDGFVNLPVAEDVPFRGNFECHVFRNYTLVKDGILNMETIPASMSEDVFNQLQNNNMIDVHEVWESDKIYLVDLRVVPIVNKDIASPITSTEYISMLNEELELEYRQKFLKYLINDIDPTNETKEILGFSDREVEYLKHFGLSPDRTYSPQTTKSLSVDYYYAKEFTVKIKSFSSAPKVEEVLNDINAGKNLSPSKSLMKDVSDSILKSIYAVTSKDNKAKLARIMLDETRTNLSKLRSSIQKKKFAILLCKQWFTDLATRDGAVVNFADREYTFSIKDVRVDY